MIVVVLRYTADISVIDELRPAHRDWLQQALDDGRLLMAGPKNPREGGMFLVRGALAEVKAWAANAPFALAGAADYDVFEIEPTIATPAVKELLT